MRDGHFYENFCMDQRKHVSNDEYNNHSGNGTFVIGVGKGDPDNDPTTNNRVENNIIFRPISQTMFAFVDTVQVRASGNVIVDWLPVPKGGQRRMNGDSGDMYSASATYNNIQCPDDGIQHGLQTHGSETPNKINRPMAECTARIHQIIGKPEITFCEVGNVDDKIVLVNVSTPQNPPARLKSGGQLQVTFNGTNQTGENTTHHSEQQMRIALTTAPDSDDIVRVYAAEGVIQNSAFIGGKSCLNGDNYGNEDYTRGEGFCGENDETDPAIECTNNITDDGPRLLRKH